MDETTALVILATSPAESEAYQMLVAQAHRKTGAIPPELVVRHVLAVTAGADWPVRREALEALLRRFGFGQADRLQIVTRPGGGGPLGLYATRRQGSPARPYRTLLRCVEPIEGSCSCPDFLRSSLGLCKHLLAVLEDIASKQRGVERARRAAAPDAAPLRWDPIRPLTGGGDWLARIHWMDGSPAPRLRRWLRPAAGGGFTTEVPEAPARRLALVDTLLGVLGNDHGEPALHALLLEDRRRTARAVQGGRDLHRFTQAIRSLKQRLYPYQREAVERFLSNGRLLLADDMGLGKTAQAIAACPPCGVPAASAGGWWSSRPRSSPSGCASGSSSPTRPPPRATATPPTARGHSRP